MSTHQSQPMRIAHPTLKGLFVLLTVTAVLLAGSTVVFAAPEAPTKFLLSSHLGADVNRTTGENVCTIASKDQCQPGSESGIPGGFGFPETLAVAPNGNVYVADNVNHRVQEFDPEGKFVLMFGLNVNKTKIGENAPQSERNECSAGEVEAGANCGAGEKGAENDSGEAQSFTAVQDVTVDPHTGDVYVRDDERHRVDEFTATGEFVLMIGGEVNETTKGNVCTEEEVSTKGVKCKTGVQSATGSIAHGAFKPEEFAGNLLAAGGPHDLLYVGDEGRVQEFDGATGAWVGEITGTGTVEALAVDGSGNVYVSNPGAAGVHVFNANGQLQPVVIDPDSSPEINALAVDAYGRLGIVEHIPFSFSRGVLYSTSGVEISQFAPPSGEIFSEPKALAFDDANPLSDVMYVAGASAQEVEVYAPVLFPEAKSCGVEELQATSAVLCGEIDPKGLFTTGFFDYSPVLGSRTPVVFEGEGLAFAPVRSLVDDLEPNETYRYEVVAEAEVNGEKLKEQGGPVSFHTPTPAPEMPGEPIASFVTSDSAVLGGMVNPEHALTRYHFEYAACPTLAECASVDSTENEQSSQYGPIDVRQEAEALLPATTYRYRLVAENEHEEASEPQGGQTTGVEGIFTTQPAARVNAVTGLAGAIGTTSATISGTVDPDGEAATYSFELGVDEGVQTQYGIVFSGPAGASPTPVAEALELSGLQPGVEYAYRVTVRNGYGSTSTGATLAFTTGGLPTVLISPASLAFLATPDIGFPKANITPGTKKATKKKIKARKKKTKRKISAKKSETRKHKAHKGKK